MPRNSSGTMSLPTGNPVVTGTKITSTWANNTMNDLANELTNSLDRSGRGRMTVPILQPDSSVSLPGYSWVTDPDTGMYNPTVGALGLASNGVNRLYADDNGTFIPNLLGASNRMINGGCRISQYGSTSYAASYGSFGGCDRMITSVSGTTVAATVAQASSPVAGIGRFGYVNRVTFTTTGSTLLAASQRVESANTLDLNGKQVVFSVVVHQDTGSSINFTPSLIRPNAVDNYGAGNTTLYTGAAVTVPSGVATKVEMTALLNASDASNGIQPTIQSAALSAATNKHFDTADWYFNVGSQTPTGILEPTGIQQELDKCMRYYQLGIPVACGLALTSTQATFAYQLPVPMRTAPTFIGATTTSRFNVAGVGATLIAGTWGVDFATGNLGVSAAFTRTAGTWTAGQAISYTHANVGAGAANAPFVLSAEL